MAPKGQKDIGIKYLQSILSVARLPNLGRVLEEYCIILRKLLSLVSLKLRTRLIRKLAFQKKRRIRPNLMLARSMNTSLKLTRSI